MNKNSHFWRSERHPSSQRIRRLFPDLVQTPRISNPEAVSRPCTGLMNTSKYLKDVKCLKMMFVRVLCRKLSMCHSGPNTLIKVSLLFLFFSRLGWINPQGRKKQKNKDKAEGEVDLLDNAGNCII